MTTPTTSPSASAEAMPSASEPVSFMMTISGMATAASSEPIEMSTSPEMKTMAQPMPAIIASEAWPSTLVMLRSEKKFSAVTEKKAMTTSRQISSASSWCATRDSSERGRRSSAKVATVMRVRRLRCA